MSEPDTLLLERCRQGDSTAFEQLFLRYYPQVYRVLYSLLRNREEAEDLAQETFLALYNQPPHLPSETTLIAWLCRVALNRGYNALRGQRRSRQRMEQLVEPPVYTDPDQEVVRAEERRRVRDLLAQLPERQGRLLVLRYAGMSYAEIAIALDLAPSSIGTLLARAERAFLAAYHSSESAQHNASLAVRNLS